MAALFSDSTFWVLLSTIVCVYFILKHSWGVITASLDDRTDKIKKQLEDAERLKVEAQEQLARYQRKHKNTMKEADAIIAGAQQRVTQLEEKAAQELHSTIKKYELQARERIELAEKEAIAEIKGKIADLAVEKATAKLKAANLNKLGDDDTIIRTVDALKKTLH